MNEFKVKKGLIIQGSGSALLDIQGSQGQLFSITDSLEGSLFSVNDISGIPVMEVFSDDTINLGTFGDEAIKISGNTANITGSLFGTSSFATTAGSTSAVSGTTNYLPKFTGTSTLGNSLVFDNGTNVGIGTTTPSEKLEVGGGDILIGNNSWYRVRSSSGTSQRVLGVDTSNTVYIGGVDAQLTTSVFRTAGVERMRITSAGNVGIGTTSPQRKLSIEGSSTASSLMLKNTGTSGQEYTLFSTDNSISTLGTGNFVIYDDTNSVSRMVITPTGNVGIGTTSPSAKLHIDDTFNATGNFRLGDSTVYTHGWARGITTLYQGTSGGIKNFMRSGLLGNGDALTYYWISMDTTTTTPWSSTALRIYPNNNTTFDGNVGIGTTTPSEKLHVQGTTNGNVFTVIENLDNTTSARAGISLKSSSATGGITITSAAYTAVSNWNDRMIIGTDSNASNGVLIRATSGGVSIIGDGGTQEANLRIDTTGNVGIGTTSPSYKLSVVGKISLNDGGNSVFVGQDAGLNDDATDNRNVGIGYRSLYLNTTGFFNTANGFNSLYNNTTGNSNTANGFQSLLSNTTGANNTAIGLNAGRYAGILNSNSTGTNSVFLGYLTKANANGQTNQIVIGSEATGIGSNTVTLGNDAIVTTALKGNVGIGTTAPSYKLDVVGGIGVSRTSGIVFTGATFAGSSIKTDTSNTLIFSTTLPGVPYTETKTMYINDGNVGIGVSSPAKKLHISSTDQSTSRIRIQNTATGGDTFDLVAGAHNALQDGFSIFNSGSATTNLYIEGTGDVGIGNTFPAYRLDVTGTIRATGDVIAFSDIRVKENINTIENALEKVKQLRGIEYNKIGETKQNIGVVAQEVEKILPEVVHEDEKGMKSVAYGNIVGVLIEAIKEQQKQIDELKKLIK